LLFAVIAINGKIVYDDNYEPLVIWNQGRGGLHVEHRLLPVLLDKLPAHHYPGEARQTLIEIVIRYSPCTDKCENIQSEVQDRVNENHPGARILWRFLKEYEGKNIARAAVERKQQQGILIAKIGQLASIGFGKDERDGD